MWESFRSGTCIASGAIDPTRSFIEIAREKVLDPVNLSGGVPRGQSGQLTYCRRVADAHSAAASALAGGESQPAFVGNFEAASGPGYGVLLDDLLPGWRRQLSGTSDVGDLLGSATNRPPTADLAVASARYDSAALRTAEEARDRAQQVRVAELRRRFVDGPALTMPAVGRGTSDTTGSIGILGAGTVFFNNYTLSGQWGRPNANFDVIRDNFASISGS